MPRVRMNTTQHGAKFISQSSLWRGLDAYDTSPYLFAGSGSTSVQPNIVVNAFVSGHDQKDLTRFTDGDLVPPLQFGTFYRTNNSGPTVISNFRNGWPRQKLDIFIEDSYTGLTSRLEHRDEIRAACGGHQKETALSVSMTAIYGVADRPNNNAAFILPVNYQSGARVPAGQRQRRAQTLNSSLSIRAFPYRKRPHNLQMKNQFREALTGLNCKFVHNLRVS
jgi:hypothetical protein